jgi:hypothetical protein
MPSHHLSRRHKKNGAVQATEWVCSGYLRGWPVVIVYCCPFHGTIHFADHASVIPTNPVKPRTPSAFCYSLQARRDSCCPFCRSGTHRIGDLDQRRSLPITWPNKWPRGASDAIIGVLGTNTESQQPSLRLLTIISLAIPDADKFVLCVGTSATYPMIRVRRSDGR